MHKHKDLSVKGHTSLKLQATLNDRINFQNRGTKYKIVLNC